MFAEWQKTYKELRDKLEAALAEKKREAISPDGKSRLAEIEKSVRKLDQDGSRGVHNSQFIQDILTKLVQAIQSIA